MAITRYAGDRFTTNTSDTKPTGVLDGAYLIDTGNLTQYVRRTVGGTSQWSQLAGGGGGGTPGGANTQVQFNNAGAFGGDADLTFTDGNRLNVNKLGISGNIYDSNNSLGEGGMVLTNEGQTGVNWKSIESVLSGVGGSGVANYVARWSDEDTITTGALYDDGGSVGVGTTVLGEALTVNGKVEADEFLGELRGPVVFGAKAAEALVKGEAVYISGISGNTTVVAKACANETGKMPVFGLAHETVNANAFVEVTTFGSLSNVNTSSFLEGDELFVGITAGALVNSPPTGEAAQIQKVAKVTRSDTTVGSVKVMGPGRSNATPNLNEGRLFVGNSSNQAVADGTIHVDIANSKVGIGTNAPDVKLHLYGAGSPQFRIQDSTNNCILKAYAQDSDAFIGTHSNHDFNIGANNATHVTVKAGGSVGIGTNNPGYPLTVANGVTQARVDLTLQYLNNIDSLTNTDLGRVLFRAPYSGTGNNVGSITLRTGASPYRTDLRFKVKATGGSERQGIIIHGTNDGALVGIGQLTDPTFPFQVSASNLENGPAKRIALFFDETNAAAGTGAGIALGGYVGAGTDPGVSAINDFGVIQGIKENSTLGNYASAMLFLTRQNSANPAEQMRINSEGNVGIGTTNPEAKIRVSNSAASGGTFKFTDGSSRTLMDLGGGILSWNAGSVLGAGSWAGTADHQLQTLGTTRDTVLINGPASGTNHALYVTGLKSYFAGNVGIGNILSQAHTNENTSTVKLRVGSDTLTSNQSSAIQIGGYDSSGSGTLGAIEFFNHRDDSIAAKIQVRRDLESPTKLSAGQIDFYTDDGDNNLDVHMSIDALGRVGIGTVSPSETLEINHSNHEPVLIKSTGNYNSMITMDSNRSSANSYVGGLAGKWNGTQVASIYLRTGSDTTNKDDGYITLLTASSGTLVERMRIQSDGNVGIGTNGPNSKVDVLAASRSTAFAASNGATWHDLIVRNPNNTRNAAVGLAFELNATYHANAAAGIAAVKEVGSSDYGAGLAFVTRPQSAAAEERVRITADGNVGIGTTAPETELHVFDGTAKFEAVDGSDFSLELGRSDNANTWKFNHAGADLRIYNSAGAGSDILLGLDAGGGVIANNVGIGTATPAQKLHVNGLTQLGAAGKTEGGAVINYASFGELKGGAQTLIGNAVVPGTANNTIQHSKSDAGNYMRMVYSEGIAFHTNITGTINTDLDEGLYERMRINLAGNVGIGTNNPAGRLHASDVADFYVDVDGTDSAVVFKEGGGNSWRIGNRANGDRFNITQSETSLGSNVRLTIDNGGNVGIGDNLVDPEHRLHVSGDAIISGYLYDSTNSTGVDGYVLTSKEDGPQWKMIEDVLSGVGGNGTANYIPKWEDEDTIGDSVIAQSGTAIGIGTAAPATSLEVLAADPVLTVRDTEATVASASATLRLAESSATNTLNGHFDLKFAGSASGGDLDISRYNNTSLVAQGVRIKHDGNVGIGTTNPGGKLESYITSGGEKGLRLNSNFAGGNTVDFIPAIVGVSNAGFSIDLAGTNRLVINSNGNVGIGTNNPGYLLHVQGTGPDLLKLRATTAGSATAPKIHFEHSSGGTQTANIVFDQSGQNKLVLSTQYQSATDENLIQFAPADNVAMTIRGGTGSSDGYVGIGTATPGKLLELVGGGLRLPNGESIDWNNENTRILGSHNSNKIQFDVGGVSNVLYLSNGSVGIGTTAPDRTLDVRGNVLIKNTLADLMLEGNRTSDGVISRVNFYNTAGSDVVATISADRDGANDAGAITFDTQPAGGNNTERMRITSLGSVGIGTNNPQSLLHLSATAPIISLTDSNSFTDAGDRFIFRAGAPDGGFFQWYDDSASSTSNLMYIASSGAIQLNTYGSGTHTGTPEYKLSVDSSGNIIETAIGTGQVDGSGTANYITRWTDTDTIGNSNIFDNGTIGIGTAANLNGKVTIREAGNSGTPNHIFCMLSSAAVGHGAAIFLKTSTSHINNRYGARIRAIRNDNNNAAADLAFSLENSGATAVEEVVRFTSDGCVGIGTTAPGQKLHVNGSAEIDGSIYINDTNTRIFEGSGNSVRLETNSGYIDVGPQNATYAHLQTDRDRFYFNRELVVDSGIIRSYNEDLQFDASYSGAVAKNIIFRTGNVEKMRMNTDGELLVGLTSELNTGSKIHVNSAIALGSSTYTYSQVVGGADLQLISNGNPANLGTNSNIIFKLGTSGGGGPNEAMRIVSTGNVGIGITAPSSLLHVRSANELNATFESSDSGSRILVKDDDTNTYINAADNVASIGQNVGLNASNLNILSNGNVGTGTISPSTKLHVVGSGTDDGVTVQSGTNVYLELDSTDAATTREVATKYKNFSTGTNFWWTGLNQSGAYDIAYGTTFTNANTKLRIQTDGNVGIGTVSPAGRLDVRGELGANGTAVVTSYFVNVTSAATSSAIYIGASSGTDWKIGKNVTGITSNTNFSISDHANNRFLDINSSGNVGIGTISPAAKLHVHLTGSAGSFSNIGLFRAGPDSNYSGAEIFVGQQGNSRGLVIRGGRGTGDQALAHFYLNQSGGVIPSATQDHVMTFLQGGYVGIGTTSPAASLQIGNSTSNQPSDVAVISADGGNAVLNALSLVNSRTAALGNGTAISFHNASNYSPTGKIETVQAGDTTTDSELRFYTYGPSSLQQQMVINHDGNVGIGTTNPGTYKLNVNGPTMLDGYAYIDDYLIVDGNIHFETIGQYISFYGDNSRNHSIVANNSSGNAADDLRINTYGALFINLDSNNNNSSGADFSIGRHGSTGAISDWLLDLSGETGQLQLNKYGSGTHTGIAAYKLSVDSSGNVIETAIGAGAVDGAGTANYITKWTDTDTIGNSILQDLGYLYQAYSENNSTTWWTDSSSGFVIHNTNTTVGAGPSLKLRGADARITYGENSTNRDTLTFTSRKTEGTAGQEIVFDSDGNVGIGTTSPSAKLHVNGSDDFLAYFKSSDNKAYIAIADDDTTGYISAENGLLSIGANTGVHASNLNADIGTGRFGLGTTNPSHRLTVTGSTFSSSSIRLNRSDVGVDNDSGIVFDADTNATNSMGMGGIWYQNSVDNNYNALIRVRTDNAAGTAGRIEFHAGIAVGNSSTPRMVIKGASGNVGIGTNAPLGKLDINTEAAEATHVYINGEVNQDKLLYFRHYANSEGAGANAYLGYIGSKGNDNLLSLGHLNTSGTDVPIMHLTETGNVGIGTTNPSSKLYVDGTTHLQGDTGIGIGPSSSYRLSVEGTNNTPARILSTVTSLNLTLGNTTQTYYTDVLLNSNSGNAQVWKAGSTYTAFGGASSLNIYCSNGKIAFHPSANANKVVIQSDGDVDIAENLGVGGAHSGTYVLYVHGDGYMTGNLGLGGTLTEASSLAIKENVETFEPSLDIINKIRPVKYDKKTTGKKEIGLIAEELAELFPELVEKDKNGNPSGVNYSRAVTVLLGGFKELYKEVQELKKRI